jgi:hypothetical protein
MYAFIGLPIFISYIGIGAHPAVVAVPRSRSEGRAGDSDLPLDK